MANRSTSFLHSVRAMSYFLRLFGQHGFSIPKKRTHSSKLRIRSSDVKVLSIQVSVYLIILISAIYIEWPTIKGLSISNVIKKVLYFSGSFMMFSNILIDLKTREQLWLIISGFCDFDYVVCKSNKVNFFFVFSKKKTKTFL